ncbi:hypothetical protein [Tsukamurella sp. 1534]|uniref:hypothetical protein n=1 Tax=Tsukamurella sp. 1534 TaxID=1151061 RepID=UPI0002E44157|nr:hypothetical protein [Tsukamurella sp. 1534]
MRRTVTGFADAVVMARGLGTTWSTAHELVEVVAAHRDRTIEIAEADLTGTGITGTVLSGGDRDTIVHATGLPPFFAEHVIFHEVSHLLCGHLDGAPATVGPMTHRHHENAPHEQEAELLATAFAHLRSERGRTPPGGAVADDGGLAATLAPHLLTR